MTNVTPIRSHNDDSARAAVAGEVRGILAKRKIPAYKIGDTLGQSRGYWQRRVSGGTAFDIDDLAAIAGMLGVQIIDLIPTDAPTSPTPETKKAPTREGEGQQLPDLDSNQEPIGSQLAPVTRLPQRAATTTERNTLATITKIGA